jgi:hypothetical protein
MCFDCNEEWLSEGDKLVPQTSPLVSAVRQKCRSLSEAVANMDCHHSRRSETTRRFAHVRARMTPAVPQPQKRLVACCLDKPLVLLQTPTSLFLSTTSHSAPPTTHIHPLQLGIYQNHIHTYQPTHPLQPCRSSSRPVSLPRSPLRRHQGGNAY